ncbi:MAG: hypothetical protein IJT78_04175 [Oscillospiraceae bacterium]|nr:hypothetical protein [Oscillospiraceae bacterium]
METPNTPDTTTAMENTPKKSTQNRRILFIALGVIALVAIILAGIKIHENSIISRAERAAGDVIHSTLEDYQSEKDLFASIDYVVSVTVFFSHASDLPIQCTNGIYTIYYNKATAVFLALSAAYSQPIRLIRDFDAVVTYDPKTNTAICTSMKWVSDWRDKA